MWAQACNLRGVNAAFNAGPIQETAVDPHAPADGRAPGVLALPAVEPPPGEQPAPDSQPEG